MGPRSECHHDFGGTKVKMHVPRLLSLPSFFIKLLRDQKKALMPHEVWQVIKTFSESQGLHQECVRRAHLSWTGVWLPLITPPILTFPVNSEGTNVFRAPECV